MTRTAITMDTFNKSISGAKVVLVAAGDSATLSPMLVATALAAGATIVISDTEGPISPMPKPNIAELVKFVPQTADLEEPAAPWRVNDRNYLYAGDKPWLKHKRR